MSKDLVKIRIIKKWSHHEVGSTVTVFRAKALELIKMGVGEFANKSDALTKREKCAGKVAEKAEVKPAEKAKAETAEAKPILTAKAFVPRRISQQKKGGA